MANVLWNIMNLLWNFYEEKQRANWIGFDETA